MHPQSSFAESHIADIEAAIDLAGKTGIGIICGFAGLPGAGEDAKYPNWIIYSWPEYFGINVIKWQWEKKIVPFWKEMVKSKKGKEEGGKSISQTPAAKRDWIAFQCPRW